MVLSKIQNPTAAAVEFRLLNFGIKLKNGPPNKCLSCKKIKFEKKNEICKM